MKKIFCLALVLIMCVALAVPAFATEVDFVPSITAKPAPDVDDPSGEVNIVVKDTEDNIVHTSDIQNLLITAVANVINDTDTGISEEAAELLQQVYNELVEEGANLTEKMPELAELCEELILDIDTFVVTDLFDVTILSDELMEYLNVEGNTVELTFDANVAADYTVAVLVYKENEWQLVANAVNNGDGTITCTFEHFCPVAVLAAPPAVVVEVEEAPEAAAPEAPAEEEAPVPEAPAENTPVAAPEGAKGGTNLWWIALIVIAVAVVAVVAGKKNKSKAK